MLAITLGTGVGSAFMRDGTPLTAGTSVPPEGRLDLLRIDGRPLEATLSRRALIGAYEHRAGQAQHADDVLDIAARARAGEPVAREVLAAAFSAFGRALAPWLVRFRPQTVVLGGSVSRAFDLFIPALAAGLDQGAAGIRRQIRITRAGSENSALLGAAWAAAQHGPHDSAPQTARKRRA
jgi:glucokinase